MLSDNMAILGKKMFEEGKLTQEEYDLLVNQIEETKRLATNPLFSKISEKMSQYVSNNPGSSIDSELKEKVASLPIPKRIKGVINNIMPDIHKELEYKILNLLPELTKEEHGLSIMTFVALGQYGAFIASQGNEKDVEVLSNSVNFLLGLRNNALEQEANAMEERPPTGGLH